MPQTNFPLFTRYTRAYLADVTPYTASYLKAIQFGVRPANPTFRANVVEALAADAVDEAALFGEAS